VKTYINAPKKAEIKRLPVGTLQDENPFQGIIDAMCSVHESIATSIGCGNPETEGIAYMICNLLNSAFSVVGCEAINPPTEPECDNDDDCGDYEVCLAQLCEPVECKRDDQCDEHELCNASYKCEWRSCDNDGECPDGVCISGYCEDCREDDDCSEGEMCETKQCVPFACSVDGDCPQPPESDYRFVCVSESCEPDPTDCRGPGLSCQEPNPACDPSDGTCVECVIDDDCDEGFECVENACLESVECRDDEDCLEPTLPACKLSTNTCVECTSTNDEYCDGLGEVCDTENSLCVGCLGNLDCPPTDPLCSSGSCSPCVDNTPCIGRTDKEVCKTDTGECVFCVPGSGCPPATPVCVGYSSCAECTSEESGACNTEWQDCVSNQCVPKAGRCESNAQCGGGTPYCNTSTHYCAECLLESHCPDQGIWDPELFCYEGNCVECTPSDVSRCDKGYQNIPEDLCLYPPGECVECRTNADCTHPYFPVCKTGDREDYYCICTPSSCPSGKTCHEWYCS